VALPVVRSALKDTHPNVLYAATLSLLELAHEGALEELGALIENTQGTARETILRAFFYATNSVSSICRRRGTVQCTESCASGQSAQRANGDFLAAGLDKP
jgi:hypothetical protein